MDKPAFYAALRATSSGVFGTSLSSAQVQGTEELLDEAQKRGVRLFHLAYILATVYHETGGKMVPVREGFANTDAGARAVVAKLFAKGVISRNYAEPINGISYYGRGRVQNTHLVNYQALQKRFGLPFVNQPDLLLDGATDAMVTVVGHLEGIWTGKKLDDYISGDKIDYYNARRIINGMDKAAQISLYAKAFQAALQTAKYLGQAPQPRPTIPPEPVEPIMPPQNPPAWVAPVKPSPNWFESAALYISTKLGVKTR